MTDDNPYAAPESDVATRGRVIGDGPTGPGPWRDGALLVVRRNGVLSGRCVRCGAPADGRLLRVELSWHPARYYWLLLFFWPFYLAVLGRVRRTADIEVGLCPRHWAKRWNGRCFGWLTSLAGVGLIAALNWMPAPASGGELRGAPLVLFGIVFALIMAAIPVGLVLVAMSSRVVSVKRIVKGFVWLRRASPLYLQDLPPWVGGK